MFYSVTHTVGTLSLLEVVQSYLLATEQLYCSSCGLKILLMWTPLRLFTSTTLWFYLYLCSSCCLFFPSDSWIFKSLEVPQNVRQLSKLSNKLCTCLDEKGPWCGFTGCVNGLWYNITVSVYSAGFYTLFCLDSCNSFLYFCIFLSLYQIILFALLPPRVKYKTFNQFYTTQAFSFILLHHCSSSRVH